MIGPLALLTPIEQIDYGGRGRIDRGRVQQILKPVAQGTHQRINSK